MEQIGEEEKRRPLALGDGAGGRGNFERERGERLVVEFGAGLGGRGRELGQGGERGRVWRLALPEVEARVPEIVESGECDARQGLAVYFAKCQRRGNGNQDHRNDDPKPEGEDEEKPEAGHPRAGEVKELANG